MPQIGGDTEQLQALNAAFLHEQTNVENLIAQINSSLGATWWIGPQADRFREEWSGSFLPNLNSLAAALGECAANVQQHMVGFQEVGG
jgi:uncharacterized protein YukE